MVICRNNSTILCYVEFFLYNSKSGGQIAVVTHDVTEMFMAKRKSRQKVTEREFTGLVPTGQPPEMDEADGVRVGEEPVPGMRLRCICRGHQGTIGRIAWSPCGRFIASPSTDKTIRIWDANNGNCLKVLKGHTQRVVSVAWSPDGKQIASGGDEDRIRIWNAESGRMSRHLKRVHIRSVTSLAWAPDGAMIASGSWDNTIAVWDATTGGVMEHLAEHEDHITSVAWSNDGSRLASVGYDMQVTVWDAKGWSNLWVKWGGRQRRLYSVTWTRDDQHLLCACADKSLILMKLEGEEDQVPTPEYEIEGHTGEVKSVSCSADGQIYASKGSVNDNSIRLWRADTFAALARIGESSTNSWRPGLAFHPDAPVLATLGEHENAIRVWDLDVAELLSLEPLSEIVRYTSAKIVLVGESNVGKSCLAMRLAEDRYPEDNEHGTTHGMRFWPMEAEDLHPSAKSPEGQRRDVVLWDFGGQDEYRLVHQMFLHDTTLALVLIDPTRGRAAMDEARDWNKRLEKHLGGRQAVKLLVGAKQDRKSDLIHQTAVDELCKECGFAGFIDVSARTKRKIPTLRKAIANALDWNHLAKTSRPELFQRVRDDVERRRKRREVVVMLATFKRAIKRASGELYEEAAVEAVSDQLTTQGVIVRTKLTGGDEALVLQLPVIERYAGALIVAARHNPRGVPVLEERLLGQVGDSKLPGMNKKERLRGQKEKTVLECVVELMIRHGLCFRHGGLLVFPTLFPTSDGDGEKLPHSVSLYYDFTGAIDNIYASLVARLVVSEGFGEGRLWAGRVEFDRPGEGICGLRQVKRTGGLAHVDLFFGEDTSADRRSLFTRFVEEHLRHNGVEIREHEAIKCACGEMIEERIVQANIKRGEKDVVCPMCRTRTLIGEGVERIRERDPESDHKIIALRERIEEQTARDVETVKSRVSGNGHQRRADEPIRVLHLSDLHFTGNTSPQAHLVPLLQDIRNGEFLGFDTVEYLVISGDMTDRGSDDGLDKAREFIEQLIEELGLSAQRCILVPGNHDVQDLGTSYGWVTNVDGLKDDQWVRQGNIYLVRDDGEYPKRLKMFSDAFFHKVVPARPYPLDPAEQGMSYLFEDTQIQFLAFNSAWQIDQFSRKRSGLHPDAVSNAIAEADKQIADAVERRAMKRGQEVLKICVWHHSIQHRETMQSTDSVELLQAAGVRLCLHGDVHEVNRDHFRYWHKDKMDVVGAGSFGSPAEGRSESTPRLYNLLEIQPDHRSVRVHTRRRPKPEGPWDGWHEWDNPDGKGRVPYYDIPLT